jgi:hypothetical protein
MGQSLICAAGATMQSRQIKQIVIIRRVERSKIKSAICLFPCCLAELLTSDFSRLSYEIADFNFELNGFSLPLICECRRLFWGKTLCTNLFVPHPS